MSRPKLGYSNLHWSNLDKKKHHKEVKYVKEIQEEPPVEEVEQEIIVEEEQEKQPLVPVVTTPVSIRDFVKGGKGEDRAT